MIIHEITFPAKKWKVRIYKVKMFTLGITNAVANWLWSTFLDVQLVG